LALVPGFRKTTYFPKAKKNDDAIRFFEGKQKNDYIATTNETSIRTESYEQGKYIVKTNP
jgi:hypothetical protein